MFPKSTEQYEFQKKLTKYYKEQLISEISLFILKNVNKEMLFDLTIFNTKYENLDSLLTLEIVKEYIIKNLKKDGWNSALCYGETCLCIFEKEIPVSIRGQIEELSAPVEIIN